MRGVFGALLLAAMIQGAHAKALYEQHFGAWTVGAYAKTSGEFSHCSSSAPYQSGITILFFIGADYRWNMGFVNPAWQLQEGATYPIRYQIDSGSIVPAQALVLSEHFVGVPLDDSEALFERFRRGRMLVVEASGQIFSFGLKDSSISLDAALACVTRHRSASLLNPFAPAKAKEAKGDNAAEAAAVTANLLSSAGVSGFRLLETGSQEVYDAAFTSPSLTGGLIVLPRGDVQKASTLLIATLTEDCKGQLATARLPAPGNGAHVRIACQRSATDVETMNYLFFPRAAGGSYMMQIGGGSSQTTLPGAPTANQDEAAGRLLDASLTLQR